MKKLTRLKISKIRRHSGITLVEVMAALIIGVLAFYPVIGIFQAGIKDSLHSSAWTQARELAKSHMDEILALPFINIKSGNNNVEKDSSKIFPKTETIKGVKFETSCVVHDLVPLCGTYKVNTVGTELIRHYCISGKLKGVTVTVKWQGVGKTLDYSLLTFKADLYEGSKSEIWPWP